jgi:hypothetical protein
LSNSFIGPVVEWLHSRIHALAARLEKSNSGKHPYEGNQRMNVMIHEGCEIALIHRRRIAD